MYLEDLQAGHARPVQSIESLYKPPTLIHLLESKQWDAARSKVDEVFKDLRNTNYTREHLYEVYLLMTNAFMYIAHKQGQFAYQIDQSGFDLMHDPSMVLSLDKLKGWAEAMLAKLRTELSASDRYTRSYIIHQVQELVSRDLGQDTSVKTIADKVFLHPVYLSKIYKAETGESLGDYIIRMRMERALYLLKKTNKKIYEITAELGYQNPQYFSKMFKKALRPQSERVQGSVTGCKRCRNVRRMTWDGKSDASIMKHVARSIKGERHEGLYEKSMDAGFQPRAGQRAVRRMFGFQGRRGCRLGAKSAGRIRKRKRL
ncbi:helix-turn-helix domain-containing protein [Paenibacillus sp. JTLBN-2024]